MTFDQKTRLTWILAALWLPVACWGVWAFAAREFVPSASGDPRGEWPADTALHRPSRGFTLVVALHPECPCSLATVGELATIMEHCRGQLQTRVLCVAYPDLPEPVEDSQLWQRAAHIDGVSLSRDTDGVESRRFSALTSGEVRLYSPEGKLLFHGGITSGRGHAGANPGETAVLDFVLNRASARTPGSTPVFGCAL